MKFFIFLSLIFIFYLKNVYGVYRLERKLSSHTEAVDKLVELSNGLIASASSGLDSTIRIWDPNNGLIVQNFTLHTTQISSIASLSNGMIASVSHDQIRIWNSTTGQQTRSLRNHTGTVYKLVLLKNGNLASAGLDKTIKIWNLTTGDLLYNMIEGSGAVYQLILLDDNKLASGASSGQVKIWNGATGGLIHNLTNYHSSQISSLSYLKDNLLASGSTDQTVKIWDLNKGTLTFTLSAHIKSINDILVLKNNSNFASVASDKTLRIWNPYSGESIYNLTGISNLVSLDDGLLAVNDYAIKIWNPYTGKLIEEISNNGYYLDGLLKLKDGRLLASSSEDYTIKIWKNDLGSSNPITATGNTGITIVSTRIVSTTATIKPTTTTTTLITKTTTRNILTNVSADVFSLINGLYPNMARESPQQIVEFNSNLQKFVEFLDNITSVEWTSNCFLGDQYYRFLERRFIDQKSSWVTIERLTKAIRCKRDCNFDRLIAANFSNDNANFSRMVASRLDPEISRLCLTSLKNWLPLPPPMLLNQTLNFSQILSYTNNGQLPISSIFKPFQLNNVPPSEASKLISSFGNTLDLESARVIGKNVPLNTNLSNVLAATCCVRIEIINSAPPSFLAQNIANMGINNIDDNRKAQIANLVAKSKSPDDIKNLLLNGDQKMASAISIETLANLSIRMDDIPANKLPPAYIQQAAKTEIANKNIADISDTKLARFLPALSPSIINNIPTNDKKNSVLKIMNASSSAVKPLSIVQRSALFNVILGDIMKLATVEEKTQQFENLDSSTIKAISELIVAAPASFLDAISISSKFIDVIYENAKISASKCCSFLKVARDTYAEYAIKYLANDPTQITANHLDTLGPCFASHIPLDYLNRLSGSDIYTKKSYFATSSFQPSSNIANLIGLKLKEFYSTKSSISEKSQFILEIKGLVAFLNETDPNVYSSIVETVSDQLKSERDLTDSNVQKCRLGATDDSYIRDLIKSVNKAAVLSVIPTGLLSGSKGTNTLTCSQLNTISNSLNLLSGTSFYEMDDNEFKSCLQLIGKATNNFDSNQLTKLADKVKLNYPDLSTISDTTISSINNILTAFSANDLNQLNISSTTVVQILGAISTWSSSQATVLAQKIVQKFSPDSNNLPLILNLVCGLTQDQINNIINTEFKSSVGVLSTLNLANCDSIQYLYDKTKTAYGLTSISNTYLTEFGSISAGISIADIKTLTASDINSFSSNALKIMPASTVNSFSQDNFSGLDLDQVTAMKNSQNYPSYSVYAKQAIQAVATNTDVPRANEDTTLINILAKSNSNLIKIDLKNVLIGSLFALLAIKI